MNNFKIFSIILLLFALGLTAVGCTSVTDSNNPESGNNISNAYSSTPINVPGVFEGSSSAGAYKSQPTKLDKIIDFPSMPEQLMAYQVIIPNVDQQYAKNIANKFGFVDEWPLSGGKRVAYTYTKGNQFVEIGVGGGISFWQDIKVSDIPQGLPSDQDCINIARNWLETRSLYPDNVIRTQVGLSTSVASIDPQSGKAGQSINYSKQVSFIVRIGDYEAYAPDVSITVGSKGDVVQASINTAKIQDYGKITLKTPQDAFSKLQEKLARLTPVVEEAPECIYNLDGNQVTVNSISIKYMRTFKTNYLLPIYVFEGDVFGNKNNSQEKFSGLVDAVNHQ